MRFDPLAFLTRSDGCCLENILIAIFLSAGFETIFEPFRTITAFFSQSIFDRFTAFPTVDMALHVTSFRDSAETAIFAEQTPCPRSFRGRAVSAVLQPGFP